MSIRVAVVGAAGRMGRTVCEAVGAAEDMELVAELDAGDAITRESLGGAEVAVEFSVPAAAEANALAILDSGADAVVGTTGWTDEALERVRARAEKTGRSAVIAPNYALSAVLAMSFAERAAPFFESVEVIEMHHPDKADAPSGTAISTASRIARARAAAGVSPGPETDPFGARGADYDGVRVHAVRLRGLNAHEQILLGNPGEQLVVRQDSFDRASFMPGVLLAVRSVRGRGGLTWGLEALMGL